MSYKKTLEQRQFLKNVAKALHGNEICCGFYISMCLNILDIYDQYIDKFLDAITYYESHKLEVFIKKLEDINDVYFKKFKMHDVDLRYSVHRAGMTRIGGDEFGNLIVVQTSTGDKVSLSEFTHGMQRMLRLSASLSDKCDDIHKTLTEAFQQYNEKKTETVNRRDDELRFLSRALNDKKITFDEYDKRYTEINNRYGESGNYKNYFSIKDSVVIFNSISGNIEALNIVIDHYHREVICYNKIAKAVKSKKAINMRKMSND